MTKSFDELLDGLEQIGLIRRPGRAPGGEAKDGGRSIGPMRPEPAAVLPEISSESAAPDGFVSTSQDAFPPPRLSVLMRASAVEVARGSALAGLPTGDEEFYDWSRW